MMDYERVLHALSTKSLNHELFEQFALEALANQYPGLVPITGGTDWGRDGDIATTGETAPPRLLVTKAKTLKGVTDNMTRGLASARKHGLAVDRIVLANAASLNQTSRNKLIGAASKAGAQLAADDIRDRHYFAPILRCDGDWRRRLLDLPSDPITLSPVPTDAIGVVLSDMPIIGREAELARLKDSTQDIVLYGVPGCGKSRLVTELEGVAFVDKASAGEQLAPDIRWQQPAILVVDDAGTAETLLKRLLHLRATEPDLKYRIIAICWPDEKDEVSAWLGPQCQAIELDLIERQVLDEIIVQAGITNERVRTQILNQAEGRVGWAVALASLLRRTHDGTSLLNGQALYGQVIGYLYRAKLNPHVQDILALTAILDGLSHDELGKAAGLVGISRSDFSRGLRQSAHGGLIDVVSTYGHRTYFTRPPMLATVLIAERVFNDKVPSFSLDEVLDSWADRSLQVFSEVVKAAMVGAPEARQSADGLFQRLASTCELTIDAIVLYAMLDDRAATLATEALNAMPRPAADSYASGSLCKAYASIAYGYKNAAALTALLDLAVGDRRATNAHPEHPHRLIESHVQLFTPETGHRFEVRSWTIDVANTWLRQDLRDDTQAVYAAVARACLSPILVGQSTHPGHFDTLQLREAVLPAHWMIRLVSEVWPQIIGMANEGGPQLTSALLDIATEWLAMGEGFTSSFAGVPPEAREQAEAVGKTMLQQVASHAKLSVGAAVRLRALAVQYDVSVVVAEPPDDWKPLFVQHDHLFYATLDNLREFEAQLRAWGADQAEREPTDVVRELSELKDELIAAGISWPDRITNILSGVAESVANPIEWLAAAVDGGLHAEAYIFIPVISKHGQLTSELGQRLLQDRYLRWATIEAVLSSASDSAVVDLVVDAVDASDYRGIFTMFLRKQDAPGVAEKLMAHPVSDLGGMMAYAYWLASKHRKHDTPLPPIWFESIEKLRSAPFGYGHDDYAVPDLLLYMDEECRPRLLKLLAGQFADIAASRGLANVRDSWWSKLSKLRFDLKSILWALFKDDPVARGILEWKLAGDDIAWLETELEAGRLSPGEALGFVNCLEREPDFEALARLLVPRGVDPTALASRVELTDSWGESSTRYQQLVDKFATLAQSDDDSIRLLGEAGVQLFASKRDVEVEREHQRRIRGEL